MARLPWFKYYASDWAGNTELQSSSIITRGIWNEMLTRMWLANEPGVLTGSFNEIQRLVGCTKSQLNKFFSDQKRHNFCEVFEQENGEFLIKSQRMIKYIKDNKNHALRQEKYRNSLKSDAESDGKSDAESDGTEVRSQISEVRSQNLKEKKKKIRFQLTPDSEPEFEEYEAGQIPKVVRRIFDAWNLLSRGTEKNPKPGCHLMPSKQFTQKKISAIKGKIEARDESGSHVFSIHEIEQGIQNLNRAIDQGSWNGSPWTHDGWPLETFFERSGGLQKFMFDETTPDVSHKAEQIANEIKSNLPEIYRHRANLSEVALSDHVRKIVSSQPFLAAIDGILKQPDPYRMILQTVESILER